MKFLSFFIGSFIYIFLFVSFTTSVRAATYYVSNNGSDANSGTFDSPWKTLVFSAGKLAAGDTLYIRGGIYQERINFTNQGTAAQPIKIYAYTGEKPVIDGNYQIPTSSYTPVLRFSGRYIEAEGLEVRNSLWQGVAVSGSNITITRFIAHDNMEQGILTWGSTDVIVQDSVIYNNAKSFENGVHQFSGRTSYATGLSAGRGSIRSMLRRNKMYNNWGEGLSSYNVIDTIMEDNLVYDNSKNVYISDTTGTLTQRNIIYCTPGNKYRLSSRVTQHGINLQDENQQPASADNKIINNLVIGCVTSFKWYPFASKSSMINTLVANNTFVNAIGTTSDAAFSIIAPIGQNHINSRIINNIIEQSDTKPIGILKELGVGIEFSHNVWSKAPPANMLGSNSIVADPKLMKSGTLTPGNLSADYFKLLANSPAIDRGIRLTEGGGLFWYYTV